MKLIIDIPEKVVTSIQNGEDYRYDIHTAIAQGIPYDERSQSDLISRKALKEEVSKLILNWNDKTEYGQARISSYEFVLELINNAPTVTDRTEEVLSLQNTIAKLVEGISENARPQGEWFPVNERLPESRDWYLGLFKEPDTDFIGIPYICDYVGEVTKGTTNEGWILRHCTDVDTVPDYFRNLICVAWQPLPEPYKKGGAE